MEFKDVTSMIGYLKLSNPDYVLYNGEKGLRKLESEENRLSFPLNENGQFLWYIRDQIHFENIFNVWSKDFLKFLLKIVKEDCHSTKINFIESEDNILLTSTLNALENIDNLEVYSNIFGPYLLKYRIRSMDKPDSENELPLSKRGLYIWLINLLFKSARNIIILNAYKGNTERIVEVNIDPHYRNKIMIKIFNIFGNVKTYSIDVNNIKSIEYRLSSDNYNYIAITI